jgi:hypothetical protein
MTPSATQGRRTPEGGSLSGHGPESANLINEAQAPPAPDFAATDSEGRTVRLSDYVGNKAIVLVFNRGFF